MRGSAADKIDKAVEILNEAAQERAKMVRSSVKGNWSSVGDYASTLGENAKAKATELSELTRAKASELSDAAVRRSREISDRANQMAREAAANVDKQAHQSPWYFIGGAALFGAIAGFMMSRKGE